MICSVILIFSNSEYRELFLVNSFKYHFTVEACRILGVVGLLGVVSTFREIDSFGTDAATTSPK